MEKYRCRKCKGRLSIRKILGFEVYDFPIDPTTGDLEQDKDGKITVVRFECRPSSGTVEKERGKAWTWTWDRPVKQRPEIQEVPEYLLFQEPIIGIMCEDGCCDVSVETVKEIITRNIQTINQYET